MFIAITVSISAAGLERGIELANKLMVPGLFALLLGLVAYAFATGDLERGVPFILRVDWTEVDADLILAAVGQAFYATGIGMAIMMVYGAYVPRDVSLLRSGAVISTSIIIAILASLIIFPLAFRYGIDPAQGPQVFSTHEAALQGDEHMIKKGTKAETTISIQATTLSGLFRLVSPSAT